MLYSNDYAKDKEYRARKMREAENNRQARKAQSNSTSGFRWQPVPGRRVALALVLVALLLVSALVFPLVTRAQDAWDSGSREAFFDAMVAYRMGRYYFARGDYLRAIARYEEAIAGIPQEVYEVIPGYANLYWDMGEAQFMAGQYDAALVSYHRYLELATPEASAEARVYVQQLEQAMSNGTVSEVTLMSS
jgi:tetratricopeptide (TPR) repeat protein